MVALLGLPVDAFGWALFLLLVAIVAATLLGTLVMVQGRLGPVYKRMSSAEPEKFPGYKPCCPPGLGCNEEMMRTGCRRTLAYKLADPDEVEQLDRYWSDYNRDPTPQTLRAWEAHRDTLVAHKLEAATNPAQKKLLLGHDETVDVMKPLEIASGEVQPLDDRPIIDPHGGL